MSLRVTIVGLVLVSIPFLGSAQTASVTRPEPAKPILAQTGLLADSTIPIVTDIPAARFTFEYSVARLVVNTNAVKTIFLTRSAESLVNSDFGQFVLRHMTKDQEYRFVACNENSSRFRKALATVSSGYGEFFNEDTDSVTFRGSNGTCRESPGFLYVRSQFTF